MAAAPRLSKSQKENIEKKLSAAISAVDHAYKSSKLGKVIEDFEQRHGSTIYTTKFSRYAGVLTKTRIPKAENKTLENRLSSVRMFCEGFSGFSTSVRKDEYEVVCSILDDLKRYAVNGNITAHGDALCFARDLSYKTKEGLLDALISEVERLPVRSMSTKNLLRDMLIESSRRKITAASFESQWLSDFLQFDKDEIGEVNHLLSKLMSRAEEIENQKSTSFIDYERNNDMTECPSCSADVSKAAFTCPKCGHPLKYRATKESFGCLGVILIFGIIALLLFGLVSLGN